jgi:ribosomal protein S30
MNTKGTPTRAGEVRRQAGAVATAVRTDNGLHWEVRRERDGLVRVTKRLAQTSHWRKS